MYPFNRFSFYQLFFHLFEIYFSLFCDKNKEIKRIINLKYVNLGIILKYLKYKNFDT